MRPETSLVWLTIAGALAACGAKPATPAADSTASASPASPASKPDSLALVVRPGLEVWFTDSREDRDSAGTTCLERVLEIRRDGRRIAVPLLYTGAIPRPIDDSTVEAPIYLHCRPGNLYRVNLATGYPTRVR